MTFDNESSRLFVSNNGIKMYNISNPMNIKLLKSITNQSHGVMQYHNGNLFTIKFTIDGQRICVYSVTSENDLIFVNQSEPFEYASGSDDGVKYMFFPKNDLLVTCGVKIRFWDISDIYNITKLSDYYYNDLLYGGAVGESISCAGLAFHPIENKLLIAVNYYPYQGRIHLLDYVDPTNISVIDFSLNSFTSNQSSIRLSTKGGLVSNGYYPCFVSGANTLEVMNWTEASQPKFGVKYVMPDRDTVDVNPKIVKTTDNQVLIYQILTGVIDVSNFNDVKYITETNTSKNLFSYYQPVIKDNFVFCLDWKPAIHQQGVTFFLSVWKVSENNTSKNNLWLLSLTSLLPISIITGVVIIKRRK